jgi:5-methylcytosine-specific restriction endonuclease McrA
MRSVLLLNASFEPLRIIPWQRAITLFFAGKVEVVEEYEHTIRSVSLVIQAPAVVRLLRFAKLGRRTPPLSRLNVLARDRFECQYCGVRLTPRMATLDHVKPRRLGGGTSWTNLVCACETCNRKKGGRTPEEAQMPLRTKPIAPRWLPIIDVKLHGNVPMAWQAFLELRCR